MTEELLNVIDPDQEEEETDGGEGMPVEGAPAEGGEEAEGEVTEAPAEGDGETAPEEETEEM